MKNSECDVHIFYQKRMQSIDWQNQTDKFFI